MKDNIREEIRQKMISDEKLEKQREEENEIDIAWAKPYAYILAVLVVIAVIIYLF